jgi:hypothetical protein
MRAFGGSTVRVFDVNPKFLDRQGAKITRWGGPKAGTGCVTLTLHKGSLSFRF